MFLNLGKVSPLTEYNLYFSLVGYVFYAIIYATFCIYAVSVFTAKIEAIDRGQDVRNYPVHNLFKNEKGCL